MKIINPLSQKSNGKGLMGAYEYAALIDDEQTTYGTKQKRSGEKIANATKKAHNGPKVYR